jgi:hypothetical protein
MRWMTPCKQCPKISLYSETGPETETWAGFSFPTHETLHETLSKRYTCYSDSGSIRYRVDLRLCPMPQAKHLPGRARPDYRTELFTIRMWREALNDHFEWRGKVSYSGSRKESYFRNWEALITFIEKILSDKNNMAG